MSAALIETHHTRSVLHAKFAQRHAGTWTKWQHYDGMDFQFLAVSFLQRTFKGVSPSPPPNFTKLVTKYYRTIGPSYVSSFTPNIMYLFFLLFTFVHLFVRPFLFSLEHDSFHLLPLFSFTDKEKLSLEGSEYKDGFLQAQSIRLTM